MTPFDWHLCILAVLIPLGAVIRTIFTSDIRPHLVPRTEIERLADEILNRFPADPVAVANGEEVEAWMRSDLFRMGLYRRVRLELMRRQEEGSVPTLPSPDLIRRSSLFLDSRSRLRRVGNDT